MALTIIIENQTAGTLSYLGGLVTVAASSNTTVPTQYIFPIARDPGLNFDCANGNANLNDGFTDYSFTGAVDYLNKIATAIGGAVVGQVGSVVPSYGIHVSGKDPSGNTQLARFNQFNDVAMNFRNSYRNITGNATTTVKSGSGTLHGIMVNNNNTGGTVTIYDNTAGSGTKIATIALLGGLLGGTGSTVFLGTLGLEFTTGLTIVTAGSASNDVTAIYQ
jgi:hypothetical protein